MRAAGLSAAWRRQAPVVAMAAAAVVLRLLVSIAAGDAPAFADMEQYHARASYVLHEHRFGPDALRGPGYPLLLAGAYATLGESYWSARVANALVGGLTVLVTGGLAAALGGTPWVASSVVAVYPGLVLSSIYLMPDALYGLCVVGCVLGLHRRTAGAAVLAGAIAGYALLTRSVGLVLLPAAAAAWLVDLRHDWPAWRQVAVRAASFLVAVSIVVAPWLAYTARVAGRPVLDTTSGYNALVGSNPRATGRLELADGPWLVETYMLGAASVADAEWQGLRAAARWAGEHPGPWLRLGVLKLAYLWGLEGREHSWLYSLSYFGPRRPATVTAWGAALLMSFPLLMLAAFAGGLALSGAWTAPRAALLAIVVFTSALHVLSFGESRFHLPLVPVLAALASVGRPAWHRLSPGRLSAAGVVLAFLLWSWAWQLPEMWQRLDALSGANGATSAIDY